VRFWTIQYAPEAGSDDVGKLIDKQGRTAKSLRTIFSAVGMKARRRYSLDIVGMNHSLSAENPAQ
jgi:predicted RNA-binding protein YlqC (UPF0109 family)